MKQVSRLFIILILSIPYLAADEIVLVADRWCPYNCSPEDDNPGFMVEIAKYAFEKEGHTVIYKTVPWARAIKDVRDGIYHGIIGTGKQETPDFIFPEHELAKAKHTFFVKKGSSWKYEGLESLKEINLGVIIHYSYGSLYKDYIKPNQASKRIQAVGGQTALKQNIQKLLYGRIDALIEDRTVFQFHLHKTNTSDVFLDAGSAYTEKLYIAFSPILKQSKTYAEILGKAMPDIRASGKLAGILKKYGIKDWN